MRTAVLAAAALATAGLSGCGGSTTSSTTTSRAAASSSQTTPTLCQNATECSTQTTGQTVTDVTISDPANPHDAMAALQGDYNTQLQHADQATGFAMVRSLCAPVGSTGRFAKNDYLCAAIVESTSTGQQSYGAPILFNVRSDGTAYAVGAPCAESTDPCDANYWGLVLQQWQSATLTPAPPTTTQTTSATSCGPYNVPGGNPSHYTNITVTATSCRVGHAMAQQDALGTNAPRSTIGEGWACGGPPENSDPQLEGRCVNTNGPGEVDLYANTS